MLRRRFIAVVLLGAAAAAGCGTTRSTDTARAATEMLLVSQAVDKAVTQLDFTPLAGKAVYVDCENIDKTTVDRGYLISSIRQQLLAHGALLRDDPKSAVYVVEVRTGGLGTDRHSMLVGTPQLSLPALLPGMPTNIPEVALYKKTDQRGIAKVGVFAYNRVTGRAVWQSGLVENESRLKDRWFLGTGPYTDGTIRERTEFAGEQLPTLPRLPLIGTADAAPTMSQPNHPPVAPAQAFEWVNSDAPPPPQPVPFAMVGLTGAAAVVNNPLLR